ncbi:hypothetical protein CU254_26905 [Amycolatopsis sp. AA4]|uniref:hypothetical protein n=1 Tax=Actinomycetes TaxID=1760 RepID=UPI0001B560CA|nr:MULTISPECIES: hypothetical protein [Actinomycetes]ATY13655.1 hypothetical protein CU254_26905 [Amycolatopsis sp. AA4]EFL09631.1 predicted protein [Streptomyces sp. AA4]
MLLSPAVSQTRSRLLGSVLALSAVTHVSQLAVYGTGSDTVGSAAFGVLYAVIAAGVFRRARPFFLAAAVFPAIGGLLGLYRLVAVHPNPFSVFHPILDVVIVPLAISLWRGTARK